MRRKTRVLSGLLLAVALAPASPGRAQDVLSLGSVAGAEPGTAVEVPIFLQDRSGTLLGGDAPLDRRIQAFTVTVVPSPVTAVASLEFLRTGASAERTPIFETQVPAGPARSWIASFALPLPLTLDAPAPGDELGWLRVELADGVAAGTMVALDLVAVTTAVSNATATTLETAANGGLTLAGGEIGVGVEELCLEDATSLCLNDGRFRVEVVWEDFDGNTGVGHAVPLTTDTGLFWFFDEANIELVVKALDGRSFNGNFWFFYGALSNVEYTITVTDTVTGEAREYVNPSGTFASVGDTGAFPAGDAVLTPAPGRASLGERPAFRVQGLRLHPTPSAKAGDCVADDTSLCLSGNRFRVEASWTDFDGNNGVGESVPRTADTGMFYFFDEANIELVVKVLDGRTFNGYFWVFYGALSNVEFALTVTDTETGEVKVFENPLGNFASVGDTEAFLGF